MHRQFCALGDPLAKAGLHVLIRYILRQRLDQFREARPWELFHCLAESFHMIMNN
jgi:hypothetical protein